MGSILSVQMDKLTFWGATNLLRQPTFIVGGGLECSIASSPLAMF